MPEGTRQGFVVPSEAARARLRKKKKSRGKMWKHKSEGNQIQVVAVSQVSQLQSKGRAFSTLSFSPSMPNLFNEALLD